MHPRGASPCMPERPIPLPAESIPGAIYSCEFVTVTTSGKELIGEVGGKEPPLAAGAREVLEGVDHLPQTDDGWTAHVPLSLHQRSNHLPLLIGQIGRVAPLYRCGEGRWGLSSVDVPSLLSCVLRLPKRPLRVSTERVPN